MSAIIKNAKSDEERKKAISDVRKRLEKEYDGYIEATRNQIEQLQNRIKKLESHLEKREAAKDRLVELKLELLVSEADGMGWPSNNQPARVLVPGQSIYSPRFPMATESTTVESPPRRRGRLRSTNGR